MQFKVPVASVVAATLIAGIAGAYAFVGGTANLNSSPSSATVTASAAGLKATANGATAEFDATGDVPSGSIELPIPPLPVMPSELPAVTASVPGTGAAVAVGSGKVSKLALPVIIPVTEFRDIYGVGLTNMIGGADPAAELKKATEQFAPVLARSEG